MVIAPIPAAGCEGRAKRGAAPADGNKRVAFVAMAVFLGLNGLDLIAEEPDVVSTMIALASGNLEEAELAEWIR